jgi:crotonobetainyl-CoA:carnitine CoA-transferase CaiB-like acyl-CoA transferase
MKALHNIRVLDLTRALAGPYCTQMLGDLGAEIIKIEKPGAGDDSRIWGPPFLKDAYGNDTTESAYYLSLNRNKKSVAVDVTSQDGQLLILKLLEHCDVLIENFKVGGLEKYGLSYAQVKDRFPKLVYCSITGFGQDGPLAHDSGYDMVAQAMGGLMSVTGEPDGEPMKVGVPMSDMLTGLNAAIGILAALNARHKTGKGQYVDVALVDCTLASLTNLAQYYLTSKRVAPRYGNTHSTIVPYQVFETNDGHVIVGVGNDEQFKRFCTLAGFPEWANDLRFAKNSTRVKNRGILVPMIAEEVKSKSTAWWIKGMRDYDIPGGPVNKMDDVFTMPQTQHRKMEITMHHPASEMPIHLVGSPLKLSETPVSYEYAPPMRGQHTQEVLEKLLKLQSGEIEKLGSKRIIEGAKAS